MNLKNTFIKDNYLFSIIYFFYYCSIGSYNAFIFLYFQRNGLDGKAIGILAGWAPFIIIISQFVWGPLADKVVKKNILIFTLNIIVAIFAIVHSLSVNFYFLFFIITIFNFFNAPIAPLTDSATLSFLNDDPTNFGKYRLWGSISFCFSTYLTGALSDIFGLQVIFYVFSIAIFIVAFFSYFIRPEKMHFGIDIAETKKENYIDIFKSMLELFKDKILLYFWLGNFLFFVAINANFVRYPLLWFRLGGNNTWLGFSWTVGAILEVPIFLYSMKIFKKWKPDTILIVAALIASVRWFIFYKADTYWWLFFSQPLHAIIFSLMTCAGIYFLNAYVKHSLKYTAQTLLASISFGLSAVIGNYIAGVTYFEEGQHIIYFYLMLTSLLAFFCFYIFKRKLISNNINVKIVA
jgi:MFS transporter, PPP family, 3-phenylpropionic acid transporter